MKRDNIQYYGDSLADSTSPAQIKLHQRRRNITVVCAIMAGLGNKSALFRKKKKKKHLRG